MELKTPIGFTLYSITCTNTNKVYIGVCRWWAQRKGKHLLDLRKNSHVNTYLQYDFNLCGENSIAFDIIQVYKSKHEALLVEKYYTDVVFRLNKDYCYNILSGGANVQQQITKRNSEKIKNDTDYRNRICEIRKLSMLGKKLSGSSKEKIRQKAIGRKASDETKKKMSDARQGANHGNAKKVVDENTGKVYGCLKDAAEGIGMKYDKARARINGYNNQKTSLKWL